MELKKTRICSVTREGRGRMKRGGPTLYQVNSYIPKHVLHHQLTTHLQLHQETNQTGPALRIGGRADNRKGTSKMQEDKLHFIYWPQNDWI